MILWNCCESLACGWWRLPCGETGWIVEDSEDAICEGLKKLLASPELLEQWRDNGGMERICDSGWKYRCFMEKCCT